MARRATKQAAQGQAPRARRTTPMWIAIIAAMLVIVSLPTVLLAFFAMLPTIVAFVVDRSKQKYATFCVGGMNFCGTFPYLLDLWQTSHTIKGSLNILTDVFALMVMYSAAGIGWVLYSSVPPVIATFLTVIAQRKVAALRETQKEIIEEWGEEVANPHGE